MTHSVSIWFSSTSAYLASGSLVETVSCESTLAYVCVHSQEIQVDTVCVSVWTAGCLGPEGHVNAKACAAVQ